MKKILLIILLANFSAFAQYSPEYKTLVANISKPTDSVKVEQKFKNGKVKSSGYQVYYIIDNQEYIFLVGKHYLYFKNGQWNETVYDSLGNLMSHRAFDPDGNIYFEQITSYISTTAKSITEFFNSDKHLIFERNEKKYHFSNKLHKYYLKEEGHRKNGKKAGNRNFYNEDGTLKRRKNY
jgi:hypothetical protein